jgi:hypothetical protein
VSYRKLIAAYSPDELPQRWKSRRKHECLSPELTARAKAIWQIVKRVCWWQQTEGQWVDGFLYDDHPEREIAIWEDNASRFLDWLNDNPGAGRGRKRTALLGIVHESMRRNPITFGVEE